MTWLIVTFRNFETAPKNYSFPYIFVCLYEIYSSFSCEEISLEVYPIILNNITYITSIKRLHQSKEGREVSLYTHGKYFFFLMSSFR